ncbi:hypothetical protein LPH55_02295 [Xylella taiwanensis]|nr:hypothetical protein [Xylella taiwanensis]MCD8461629.1 hypothetical protein [Xylella taiwanensis]MCD8472330.1 hypothetical protein [Xylella taiwanensis]UFN29878.1 hypothetical protein LPH46_02470 [Xylella taiwanensis]
MIVSILGMFVIPRMQDDPSFAGIFYILRWVPYVWFLSALMYLFFAKYQQRQARHRLWQIQQGYGVICPRCGGPLDMGGKPIPYDPDQTCLACEKYTNERHYR